MGKIHKLLSLDSEIVAKLEKEENMSALVNTLLEKHFAIGDYMKMSKEQLKLEQEKLKIEKQARYDIAKLQEKIDELNRGKRGSA